LRHQPALSNTLHISALPISIEDFLSVLIFFAG